MIVSMESGGHQKRALRTHSLREGPLTQRITKVCLLLLFVFWVGCRPEEAKTPVSVEPPAVTPTTHPLLSAGENADFTGSAEEEAPAPPTFVPTRSLQVTASATPAVGNNENSNFDFNLEPGDNIETPLANDTSNLPVLPVLMYHAIAIPPEDAGDVDNDFFVTPDNFREQLSFLAQNGYQSIDFYDLTRAIAGEQALPPKPIILTFDDGYRNHYENAFPILQEFAFTGTFFVITDYIDQEVEDYLTWSMVVEMANAGMRIESHSRTEMNLRDQTRTFIVSEIGDAQEAITTHTGSRPRYFAYPRGQFDGTVMQVLREMDYWGAVVARSDRYGFAAEYQWPRLFVRYNMPLTEFAALVKVGESTGG